MPECYINPSICPLIFITCEEVQYGLCSYFSCSSCGKCPLVSSLIVLNLRILLFNPDKTCFTYIMEFIIIPLAGSKRPYHPLDQRITLIAGGSLMSFCEY